MISIFKKGGPWKTEGGLEYTVKNIESKYRSDYLSLGWADSLEKLESSSNENKDEIDTLRSEIKKLGGSYGPRAGVESLKATLKELKENGED